MEHTVHPLLALVEDNQNGLKLLLKNYIDFTVEQQFDYFKNRILKMMENGLIDPLYSESDHVHLTRTGEQTTWPATPLTNSIYTEPVKKRGFDDDDDDDGDENDNEDIMDYENRVNGICNSVSRNYDNTPDDADMRVNGNELCEPNVNASLESNQINSPIFNLPDQEDLNIDIKHETTENANNLNGESHLHIPRSKSSSTKLNFKNKTRQMPKRRTRQNTKSANKQNNNQQSIASNNSGLRSSSRKRIPKKVFSKSNSNQKSVKRVQSIKSVKKVKLQSVVNDDETDEGDDDDGNDVDQMNREVIVLELHCTEPGCGQILSSRSLWRKHIKNVHKKTLKNLYPHLANNARLNHLNQTEHFCTHTNCDVVCKSKETLKKHWRYHHQPGKFACPLCPFVANLYYKVRNHRHVSHGSHRCTYRDCGKVFPSNVHLKRHSQVHIEEKQYECIYENCGLRYKFARDAVRHVRVHHFNLHSRIKYQKEENIIDTRDPLEFVRNTLECEQLDV